MSLTVDSLRGDVRAVGELGDDTVAEVADRIAILLSRSVPGVVLDLLSQAAAELSSDLPGGRVEVRVSGDDVALAYVAEDSGTAPPAGEPEGELTARITLRLSEGLKLRVEKAAAAEGISVNSHIVRTLDRSTTQGARTSRGGTRLRGYAAT
jgi:HicB family